ncbi:hypothetical protein SCHPADRAFT_943412 [Schizopora paradoxa]|uniref:Zn(2)-C6 fungal-type domain-containing protein n=1 Tax=Schizopora paradoxa TaxID=27342 RepID=A0A0H2RCW5_9AGAM|nr:hypothetical protein SCHPADRAFT_943412 [Schizopora paradoxa]
MQCDGEAPSTICSACWKRGYSCSYTKYHKETPYMKYRYFDPCKPKARRFDGITTQCFPEYQGDYPTSFPSSQCVSTDQRTIPRMAQSEIPDLPSEDQWSEAAFQNWMNRILFPSANARNPQTESTFEGSFGMLPSAPEGLSTFSSESQADANFCLDGIFGCLDDIYSPLPAINNSPALRPEPGVVYGRKTNQIYSDANLAGLYSFESTQVHSMKVPQRTG